MPMQRNHAFNSRINAFVHETYNGAPCIFRAYQDGAMELVTYDNGENDHIFCRAAFNRFPDLENDIRTALENAGYPKTVYNGFTVSSAFNAVRVCRTSNSRKGEQESAIALLPDSAARGAYVALGMEYFALVFGRNGQRRAVLKAARNAAPVQAKGAKGKADGDAMRLAEWCARLDSLARRVARKEGDARASADNPIVREAREYKRQVLKFKRRTKDARAFMRELEARAAKPRKKAA